VTTLGHHGYWPSTATRRAGPPFTRLPVAYLERRGYRNLYPEGRMLIRRLGACSRARHKNVFSLVHAGRISAAVPLPLASGAVEITGQRWRMLGFVAAGLYRPEPRTYVRHKPGLYLLDRGKQSARCSTLASRRQAQGLPRIVPPYCGAKMGIFGRPDIGVQYYMSITLQAVWGTYLSGRGPSVENLKSARRTSKWAPKTAQLSVIGPRRGQKKPLE